MCLLFAIMMMGGIDDPERRCLMKDRKITVYNSRKNIDDPCIILQGKWLEAAGFEPGDKIIVKCKRANLTIQIVQKYSEILEESIEESPKQK